MKTEKCLETYPEAMLFLTSLILGEGTVLQKQLYADALKTYHYNKDELLAAFKAVHGWVADELNIIEALPWGKLYLILILHHGIWEGENVVHPPKPEPKPEPDKIKHMTMRELWDEQKQLAWRIADELGIDIVTCGYCGEILMIDTKKASPGDEYRCYHCGRVMSFADFPDLWFDGGEYCGVPDEQDNTPYYESDDE